MITEDHLAARIETMRTARGWSYGRLSQALSDAGCPVERSSLQKIEKARPRRRITVDEMGAFAKAFDISVCDLLDLEDGSPNGMSARQSETLHRISGELLALTDKGTQ